MGSLPQVTTPRKEGNKHISRPQQAATTLRHTPTNAQDSLSEETRPPWALALMQRVAAHEQLLKQIRGTLAENAFLKNTIKNYQNDASIEEPMIDDVGHILNPTFAPRTCEPSSQTVADSADVSASQT
ncbi:hypothetical protein MFLAVUS_010543 [Mucor flavus]|uniref:Uncharacterized protein n=1 Tax=Mucor flavus TaxID=439312 RepID=A0ABP9ZD16_9FUNG